MKIKHKFYDEKQTNKQKQRKKRKKKKMPKEYMKALSNIFL